MTVVNTNIAAAAAALTASNSEVSVAMERLSRGSSAQPAHNGGGGFMASIDKFSNFSRSSTIIANLALQEQRQMGNLLDTQFGKNWGLTDDRIGKINRQEALVKQVSTMLAQANQQPAGVLALLE